MNLEQPEYGGTIQYFGPNGKEITTKTYKTTSGTELTMRFLPWEGWINRFKNGEVYITKTDAQQTATIQSQRIDSAFSEDPEHKPTLEVILDKSVGENMKFNFGASGLSNNDYKYEDGWFRGSYTVIEPTQIGTETGITLSMENRALKPGTAIKILVEREDIEKNKTAEYRLVNDLTELQDPILIYEENELGKSKIWYKSIKITISIVDILTFSTPPSPADAIVTVKCADTMKLLKQGDILEGNTKVIVTITPNNGFYVSGRDIKNDAYQGTMKFSKYQSDIRGIIDKHPIGKYYQIHLDANDSYGECIYKLDGDVVSGTIRVKEGQKLTLEYKITSSGYVIDGAKGILFDIGKNDQAKTESITIAVSMDGQTVNKATFGIQVVKEG